MACLCIKIRCEAEYFTKLYCQGEADEAMMEKLLETARKNLQDMPPGSPFEWKKNLKIVEGSAHFVPE